MLEIDTSGYHHVDTEIKSQYQDNDEAEDLIEHQLGSSTESWTTWKANFPRGTPGVRVIIWILLSILLAILITTTALASHQWSPKSPGRRPCGKTHAEAQAAGCIYDVMMDEWLPDHCSDPELTEEFKRIKDWPFFSDSNGTQRISAEELSRRVVAYTTLEYHVAHCSFAMRKLHRAILHGRQIETNVAAEEHTTHCAEFLRGKIAELELANRGVGNVSVEDVITPLHPGYPRCIDAKDMLRR